jgi:signal transduction histidine kinase
MNLSKKLLTTFSGLALLALATAGVTVWAIAQWQNSERKLQGHYQRSLLLKNIRTATFRAFKEVPDAIVGNDPDARQEFEAFLKPAKVDFQLWAELADTQAEQKQVQQVRAAYDALIQDARTVFTLVEREQRDRAFAVLEQQLEGRDFIKFEEVTQQAVTSDRQNREIITQQTQNTRQTAQLVLAIAAFGTISLLLLLAAYLASDLFAPLREVENAIDDAAKGDMKRRLSEEGQDELGAISRAFNRMMEAMAEREQVAGLAAVSSGVADSIADSTWQHLPSRVTLHRLVSQLRSRVAQLHHRHSSADSEAFDGQQQAAIAQLDLLLQAVSRITDFGFPLDLNLARTDIRALLYDVLLRFQAELVERAVSVDLALAPEVSFAVLDRLKFQEVLSELVRNALAALPEKGGRIGLRTRIDPDATELLVEVADNGRGIQSPAIEQVFHPRVATNSQHAGVGLSLTKAIVEQHGGQLTIDSEPGQGTYVQISLPLRA